MAYCYFIFIQLLIWLSTFFVSMDHLIILIYKMHAQVLYPFLNCVHCNILRGGRKQQRPPGMCKGNMAWDLLCLGAGK